MNLSKLKRSGQPKIEFIDVLITAEGSFGTSVYYDLYWVFCCRRQDTGEEMRLGVSAEAMPSSKLNLFHEGQLLTIKGLRDETCGVIEVMDVWLTITDE